MEDLKEDREQVHVIHGDTLPSTLTSNPIFQALQNQVNPAKKGERRLTVLIQADHINAEPEDIANWILAQKLLKDNALFGIAERISCNTKKGLITVTLTEEIKKLIMQAPKERRFRQFRDRARETIH